MYKINFSKPINVHFMGIGGISMSGLAEILLKAGFKVTGSDMKASEITDQLADMGALINIGQCASNITDNIDLVVYTAAIHPDNEEFKAAVEKNIPMLTRAQLLGQIMENYKYSIAVSGTHGKTTTTSMLSYILIDADTDPTISVGGILDSIGGNIRVGKSEYFVTEACEYTNSYHAFKPFISIILNVDADHLDFFKTMDNLRASFTKFCDNTTDILVVNGDDENTMRAVKASGFDKQIITFGKTDNNRYYPENIKRISDFQTDFDLMENGKKIERISIHVPGAHNVLNAVAACAAALATGVTPENINKGLSTFWGAGRRFERLATIGGITVVDDYAHHPAEVAATLKTAKAMQDFKRVWAVHQPFTYSRTYTLMDDFASALEIADKVVLTEIMGSREKNTYNVYSADLAAKIPGCKWFPTFEEVARYVADNAESGDMIITLGCGDVYKVAFRIEEMLKEKNDE